MIMLASVMNGVSCCDDAQAKMLVFALYFIPTAIVGLALLGLVCWLVRPKL